MGWTSYNAKYYTRKGTVDRKRECDAYWLEGLNSGHFNVIRSTMIGSTYYAAVQPIQRKIGEDESGNSIYEDIIDILSPTESEYALAWRQRCIDYAKTKCMRNLPIGTVIEFEKCDGTTVRLIKCAPQYQFKTAWWKFVNERKYFQKKDIPWDKVRIIENI